MGASIVYFLCTWAIYLYISITPVTYFKKQILLFTMSESMALSIMNAEMHWILVIAVINTLFVHGAMWSTLFFFVIPSTMKLVLTKYSAISVRVVAYSIGDGKIRTRIRWIVPLRILICIWTLSHLKSKKLNSKYIHHLLWSHNLL